MTKEETAARRVNLRRTMGELLKNEWAEEAGACTGEELLCRALLATAAEPTNKYCMDAVDVILKLAGQDQSILAERELRLKVRRLELELKELQTKLSALQGDDGFVAALGAGLKGVWS